MTTRNAEIIALAREGKTYREIGEKFGISESWAWVIASRVVGLRSKGKLRPSEREAIIEAAKLGWCVSEIARHLGRSEQTVATALEIAGVEAVNKGDLYGKSAREKAVKMVESGSTYDEAAKATGMTRSAVAGAVRRSKMHEGR